jgi:hypothetical protein
MRLENVLALTDGKLINDPFVKQFTNIVFDVSKVKRGDLFIAFHEESIEEAIFNGAYGILFDKPTQIRDNEIAWIKVNKIEDALKRLLRFRLIEKDIVVYECNEVILKLALQVMTEPNFIALEGDISSMVKELWDLEEKTTLLFCPLLTPREIFTKIKKIPSFSSHSITIMEQTLFESSFVYRDVFYERQVISPFFIPYLEELLHLFSSLDINFRLKKFVPIEHFEAVFTNKKFEIKEFGTSDKVLIFEKNCDIVKNEISYLQKQASWAKTIFLIPYMHTDNFDDVQNVYIYKHENEILTLLKSTDFHFALIAGVDKSFLSKPLVSQAQISLFDF